MMGRDNQVGEVADIEKRLRSAYAYISSEIPEGIRPSADFTPSIKRRIDRRWLFRSGILGAAAGLLVVGGVLTNQGSSLAFARPVTREAQVLPVNLAGFQLIQASRHQQPADSGIYTLYGGRGGEHNRPSVSLKAGGRTAADEGWPFTVKTFNGVVVRIADEPSFVLAEIDHPICGTVRISPIGGTQEDLSKLVAQVQCSRHAGHLIAELDQRPRSSVLYWGASPTSGSYVVLTFAPVRPDAPGYGEEFSLVAMPRSSATFDRDAKDVEPAEEARSIAGTTVFSLPTNATDSSGRALPRRTVTWDIDQSVSVTVTAPRDWTWDDIEPVVRSTVEVDRATWASALTKFGLQPAG